PAPGRAGVPIRLRPARAQRPGSPARAARGAQAPAYDATAECPPRPAVQRAPGTRGWRGRLPPRLQDGPRGRLEAARLALPLRPLARLAQDEEPGRAGGEAGGGRGLGEGAVAMTDLLLRQVAESRAGAEGQDDFDVIGPDGLVIGRIFKSATSPPGMPWMWTIAYGDREPAHGYEATRESAMQAFSRSWHTETWRSGG